MRPDREGWWYSPEGEICEVAWIDGHDLQVCSLELADIVIRTMDCAGIEGIDLAEAVKLKLAYNATRGYRHGGEESMTLTPCQVCDRPVAAR